MSPRSSRASGPVAGFVTASLAALALLGALLGAPRAAHAKGGGGASPEAVFAGKVILSDKRFPLTAKSPGEFIASVRKLSKAVFQEDKENKSWKIFVVAFLKAPADDIEVVIKLYDVTGKQQALLQSFEQFLDGRGQRTINSNMTLEHKLVGVNKDLLIVVESKGKQLAAGKFRILGEGERYTGKVNFSDDDATKKEEE